MQTKRHTFHLYIVCVIGIIALTLCACQPIPNEPTQELPIANQEAGLAVTETAVSPSNLAQSALKLSVEEYELIPLTPDEGRHFKPLGSTEAEVLAKHQKMREELVETDSLDLPAGKLSMKTIASVDKPDETKVEVYQGDRLVHTADLGKIHPAAIKRLLAFGNQWVLEHSYASVITTGNQVDRLSNTGDIVIDGQSLNKKYGFEESFGFQKLDGKAFFFYKRDGKYGYAWGDQLVSLGYDEIEHYQCCSAGAFNPVGSKDMVSFFGTRDGKRYYVELGKFD